MRRISPGNELQLCDMSPAGLGEHFTGPTAGCGVLFMDNTGDPPDLQPCCVSDGLAGVQMFGGCARACPAAFSPNNTR